MTLLSPRNKVSLMSANQPSYKDFFSLPCLLLPLSVLFFSSFAIMAKNKLGFVKPERMAILGDRISLGDSAHPSFDTRIEKIFQVLEGDRNYDSSVFVAKFIKSFVSKKNHWDNYKKPPLTWPSYKEFSDSFSWVVKHLILALSKLSISFPRLSWGYLTALKLGVDPSQVTIAAQPSATISQMSHQFDEVLEVNSEHFVDTYFVLFAGADLCQAHPSLIPSAEYIEKEFTKFLNYVIEKHLRSQEKSRPLQLVILNYLGITQLVSSEQIKNKKISFSPSEEGYTCYQLLTEQDKVFSSNLDKNYNSIDMYYLGQIFPMNPRLFCPTLFSRDLLAKGNLSFSSLVDTKKKNKEIQNSMDHQLSHLSSLIRGYRQKMAHVIKKNNKRAADSGVNIFFIDEVGDLFFDSTHIANDCINLSFLGQEAIAEKVLKSLL